MQYTNENYTSSSDSYYTDVVIIFVDGEAPPGAATPILGGAEEIINTPVDVGASYIIGASTDMGVESEDDGMAQHEWSWELSEHTDAIQFSPSGDTLQVTYHPDLTIFPVDALDYLQSDYDTRVRISGVSVWDQLPDKDRAPEIVYMKARTPNFKMFIASVTYSDGMASSTKDFAVIIYANYSIIRDILMEALNARRN